MNYPKAKNRAGLFLHIVKSGRFGDITQDEKNEAQRRLRVLFFPPPEHGISGITSSAADEGPDEEVKPAEGPTPRPSLSLDAQLVQELRLQPRTNGAIIFATLRTHAGWDRDRMDAATAELDNHHSAIANRLGANRSSR
jgi:hypothetical protein